jgi:hypothetical protein
MNRNRLVVGLTCSLVIALGIGKAEARQIPDKGTFSGTLVNTQIDTDGDGGKAGFSSVGLKGTLGSSTFQGVNEFVFSGPALCPNGNAGFEFTLLRPLLPAAPAQFVQRFDSTGDLLFIVQTSGTICFDPITQILFFSGTNEFIGGTGRFEGATGTREFEGTARILFMDAAGNSFGEQSGTFTGTIITP